MKDEDKLLQVQIPTIQVSNKQAFLLICALFGYPTYFGLPHDKEVGRYDSQYVLDLDMKIERLQREVNGIKASVTALVTKDNLTYIKNELDK